MCAAGAHLFTHSRQKGKGTLLTVPQSRLGVHTNIQTQAEALTHKHTHTHTHTHRHTHTNTLPHCLYFPHPVPLLFYSAHLFEQNMSRVNCKKQQSGVFEQLSQALTFNASRTMGRAPERRHTGLHQCYTATPGIPAGRGEGKDLVDYGDQKEKSEAKTSLVGRRTIRKDFHCMSVVCISCYIWAADLTIQQLITT